MLRSSSVPVPLRVLALFIVVSALVLATLAPALADQHPAAADGQRLEDQSADVQALYRAVYGGDAEARWIAEHNAAIGASMMGDSMMMADSMDPTANMYYDRIVAVAMGRGADADLANRIAVDVVGRGTEAAFLAGTDAGVLYGIGTPEGQIGAPAAAPAAAASTAAASTAAAGPPTSITAWANVSQYHSVGDSISLTLPESSHPDVDGYALDPTSGQGLTFDPDTRTLSGVATFGTFTGTYSAQNDTPENIGEPYILTVTLVIRAADLQPRFASGTTIAAISHLEGAAAATESSALPEVVTGTSNGDATYTITGAPDGVTIAATRIVTVATTTEVGSYSLMYVATDEDGDSASLPFTVTVNEDVEPVLPEIANFSIANGDDLDRFLPEATGGNGALTYSVSGLTGLGLDDADDFNATTRWLSGEVEVTLADGVNEQDFTITYTATEAAAGGADSDSETFVVTVTRPE